MRTESMQVVDLNQWVVLALLSGRLSEKRQRQLEKDVLQGGGRLEQLEMAEEELLDSHARGELSSHQSSTLTAALARGGPRLRQRAQFSRLLMTRSNRERLAS